MLVQRIRLAGRHCTIMQDTEHACELLTSQISALNQTSAAQRNTKQVECRALTHLRSGMLSIQE